MRVALMGLLQGLTEFLPISSSGHLVISRHLLGVDFSDAPLLLDTILHLGTLMAVFIVFAGDLRKLISESWQALRQDGLVQGWRNRPYVRLTGWIILATIPAVIVGFSLEDTFEKAFSSLRAVGFALLITAVLLLLTKFTGKGTGNSGSMKWWQALLIGIAQAIAITPGISRSGSTIAAGLYVGLDRETAGRFSFLIAIPAILGAVLLQALKVHTLPPDFLLVALVGFLTSAISGYFALKLLLRFVKAGQLHWFGIYCMVIGLWAMIAA